MSSKAGIGHTKAEGEVAKEITFSSRKANGYISVTDLSPDKERVNQGTKMLVKFKGISLRSISFGSYLEQCLRKYDFFSENIPNNVFMIIETILECIPNLFPTEIYINGKSFEKRSSMLDVGDMDFKKEGIFKPKNDAPLIRFKYNLSSDLSHIILFENDLQSIVRIQFPIKDTNNLNSLYRDEFKFKGINTRSPIRQSFESQFFQMSWDVLGMETKECLTLNRENFQQNELILNKFNNIYNSVVTFAVKTLADRLLFSNLESDEMKEKANFYQLRLLFGIYLEKNNEHDQEIIELIEKKCDDIDISVAENNGNEFVISSLPVRDFFRQFDNVAFLIFNNFYSVEKNLLKIINQEKTHLSFFKYLILDPQLQKYYSRFPVTYMKIIFEKSHVKTKHLVLTKINDPSILKEDPIYINIDDDPTKKYLFKELENQNRGLLPPLNDYAKLIVKKVPIEILLHFHNEIADHWNVKIISPLTKDDFDKLRKQKTTTEIIIDSLKQRHDFIKLKQWVFDNQNTPNNKKASIEDIETTYFQLIRDIGEFIKNEFTKENPHE